MNQENQFEIFETQEKKSCPIINHKCFNLIAISILFIAVLGLYAMHIFHPKGDTFVPGTGEVLYVNLDSINEKYELVLILTGDIKSEMAKQEAIFANKEKSFQSRYNQFQKNMEAGVLTQVQMENAQKQLTNEYQQLEADRERVFDDLQNRQSIALVQIYDSLQAVVKRVNLQKNASFILTYQNQNPFLIATDPTKDITEQVLFELNKSYRKK